MVPMLVMMAAAGWASGAFFRMVSLRVRLIAAPDTLGAVGRLRPARHDLRRRVRHGLGLA